MLTMPINASSEVTIIGIDPGSTRLGLSILRFSADWPHQIISTEAMTFAADRGTDKESWLSLNFGGRINRIAWLEEQIFAILIRTKPIHVAVESPFINALRPAAYGALVEVIDAIRRAVMRYSLWTSLSFVDPPTAKKAIGAPGNAKKDQMYDALMKIADRLNYVGPKPIYLLDEHSVDALAIVLWLLNRMMEVLCLKDGK